MRSFSSLSGIRMTALHFTIEECLLSHETPGQNTPKQHAANPQPLEAVLIPDALLTLRTVGAVAGISAATIYRKAASDPSFPRLLKSGKRCTRIRAGDLTAWLASQAGS